AFAVGLAEKRAAAGDDGVDAEHRPVAAVDRPSLAGGMLDGIAARLLLVGRRDRLERDPQLLEDDPTMTRGRGEDDYLSHATRISSKSWYGWSPAPSGACSSTRRSTSKAVRTQEVEPPSSRQPIGEPQRDLALCRLRRVGPVDEVVRHREREVAAQRPRLGVGRVRRADRLSRGRDRAFALEHERERRAGGDEVDELAEERLLAMLGVVRLAELARRANETRGAQHEPAALEPRDDLAGEAALDGVRLREDQRALDGHAAADSSVLSRSGTGSVLTGVSQYGHTCHVGSSGRLQLVQA